MKAIIITPFLLYPIRRIVSPEDADLIICADSAYLKAQKEAITPHAVIGDFDHGKQDEPQGNFEKLLRFSSVKDDTDTMLCVKYALNRGADDILIVGGIGGRLDHTFANLQTLAYIHDRGASGRISDGDHDIFMTSSALSLRKGDYDYASVFAYDPICSNISLKGFKYEGEGFSLQSNFPLGVSNEITAEQAEIRVGEGRLLVILAKNETTS
ncbi:MAG: thiamine diphosphokinase [Clostridia bacterium]|nr:thiamine diphosphokinase [Clostridia bacterium]